MARKHDTTKAAESKGNGTSKAEAVRQFKAEHPDLGPKEIAEALTKKGVEVTAGRVSAVLRSGGSKVDVATIRKASAFVQSYTGKLDEALRAIEAVGQFIAECGGPEKARSALEACRAVVEVVGNSAVIEATWSKRRCGCV